MSGLSPPRALAPVMFGAAMGLAGFLLFLVQPMAGKLILPWFGGSASTWIVSMLFFQAALLGGYVWAYGLSLPLALSTQAKIQIGIVAASLLFLPVAPSDAWKPAGAEDPTWRIIAILAASVGVPYMVLATTTPLLSRWLGQVAPGVSPARFFAVANAGAFLGLLAYPFLVEPNLTSRQQAIVWSAGFALYAALFSACALILLRAGAPSTTASAKTSHAAPASDAPLAWIAYSTLGSILLLATSNAITLYSAVVPFLWVLPLALYLLSFVTAFGAPRVYRRKAWALAFLALCGVQLLLTYPDTPRELLVHLIVESGVLFAGCMICHGELARLQPRAERLPKFYLAVAAGGALGGLITAVVAPLLLKQYFEHELAMLAIAVIGMRHLLGVRSGMMKVAAGVTAAFFAIGIAAAVQDEMDTRSILVERVRNFYGVLEVVKERESDPEKYSLALRQAGVDQGWQFQKDEFRLTPPCGYDEASALALALHHQARRRAQGPDAPLRIGVVGLGAGMVAGLGHSGDVLRYYELNPAVVDLAHRYFSFLREGKAKADVLIGDARLVMERQLSLGQKQDFDIIVMNAFRGASPPMHLMTKEAFEIYLAHLAPDGILAINFELDTFDMAPLHRGMARTFGLETRWFETPKGPDCQDPISWALYTRDAAFFAIPEVEQAISRWRDDGQSEMVWTDRSSNLMSILNLGSRP